MSEGGLGWLEPRGVAELLLLMELPTSPTSAAVGLHAGCLRALLCRRLTDKWARRARRKSHYTGTVGVSNQRSEGLSVRLLSACLSASV